LEGATTSSSVLNTKAGIGHGGVSVSIGHHGDGFLRVGGQFSAGVVGIGDISVVAKFTSAVRGDSYRVSFELLAELIVYLRVIVS